MNDTAKGIASLGRNGDTELVHMTPGEVRGLQQLALAHGGTLTINPHTGLPEASFLKSLLPMLIGGALSATGIGAPLAAALVGGGYGLAKGSLKEGLMAGLGAYGGAGLANSLGELGASAVEPTVTGPGQNLITSQSGTLGSMPSDLADTTSYVNQEGVRYYADPNAPGQWTASNYAANTPNVAPADVPNAPGYYSPTSYENMSMADRADAIGKGLGKINPFGSDFSKADTMQFLDKNKYQLAGALAGPVLESMKPAPVAKAGYQPDEYDLRLAKYRLGENYQPYEPPQPNPYYRAQYAKGGTAKYAGRDPFKADIPDVGIIKLDDISTADKDPYEAALVRLGQAAKKANLTFNAPTLPSTPASPALKGLGYIGAPTPMMAAGGSLGGYSDGGRLLKGPGDGMSDNIPATINKKQPARLADGEFVVPADVVSHLGNGSTDAGAKKLYDMMNKVRVARTGRKAQGRQINPGKYMPA